MSHRGMCRSIAENAMTRGLQEPNSVFSPRSNVLANSVFGMTWNKHSYCEQQELTIPCSQKTDRLLLFIEPSSQMPGHPLQPQSPDDSEESWLSKWNTWGFSEGPDHPLVVCQTLMKEAKPNQVRPQRQPKSSDIALYCDGGLWRGIVVKNPPANAGDARDVGLIPGEDPWRRKCQPTPVFLPGKSHAQRGLAAYSPWGDRKVAQLSEWAGTKTKWSPINIIQI